MDRIARRPSLEFIERFAEVLQDVLVDERHLAVGGRHRDKARNAVDDLMKRKVVVHMAPSTRPSLQHGPVCRGLSIRPTYWVPLPAPQLQRPWPVGSLVRTPPR
jgi:hypothetical protein